MVRRTRVFGLAAIASVGFLFVASQGLAAARPLPVVIDALVKQLSARFSSAAGTVVEVRPNGTLVVKFAPDRSPVPDQELFLYRSGEEVVNKLTGERLGRLEHVIGLVRVFEVGEGLGQAQLLRIKPGASASPGDVIKYSSRLDALLEPAKFLVTPPEGSKNVDDMLTVSLERSDRFRPTVMHTKGPDVEVWKERRYAFLVQPIISADEKGSRVDIRVSSRYTGEPLFVVGGNFSIGAPIVAEGPQGKAPLSAAAKRLQELEKRLMALEEAKKVEKTPVINPDIQRHAKIGKISPEMMRQFRASQDLSKSAHLLNIAMGDIDGDGRSELVGMGDRFLKFYRWDGMRFTEFQTIKASSWGGWSSFLRLDIADINGNGIDEIFVTHLKSSQGVQTVENKLRSFVLEYRGGRFVRIWSKQPYFLRVLKSPQLGRGILLAQRMGTYNMYRGPVFQLRWNGTTYEKETASTIPTQFHIYGFMVADLKDAGTPEYFVIQDNGRLASFSKGIEIMWRSNELVGGFNHVSFKQLPRDPTYEKYVRRDSSPDELMVSRHLKGRIEIARLGGPDDGHYGLLVGSNQEPLMSRGLTNTTVRKNGRVVHFAWNGISYVKEWETRPEKLHYLADFALGDIEGDGVKELVLLMHTTTYVRNPSSRLELYRLGKQ